MSRKIGFKKVRVPRKQPRPSVDTPEDPILDRVNELGRTRQRYGAPEARGVILVPID